MKLSWDDDSGWFHAMRRTAAAAALPARPRQAADSTDGLVRH
ncbi:hypothetical protein [Streptomyces sp. NPDC046859]